MLNPHLLRGERDAVAFASGKVIGRDAHKPHAVHGQRSRGSLGVSCVDTMRPQPDQELLAVLTRPVAQARCFAEAT